MVSGETRQVEAPPAAGELDVNAWRDVLERSGAIGDLFGVQYDMAQVRRIVDGGVISASLCSYNCTTEFGNYSCPSAKTLTKGARPSTLATAEDIGNSFEVLTAGFEEARAEFFDGPFQDYLQRFEVPDAPAAAMEQRMNRPGYQTNMFGGESTLNGATTAVIAKLRQKGLTVHLTTAGGPLVRSAGMFAELMESPPSVIALSADDFGLETKPAAQDIHELAALDEAGLLALRKTVPKNHGQRQKAIDAVILAKRARETPGFPQILFNMVLHDGNIGEAHSIVGALIEEFPDVLINPFPAQSAFDPQNDKEQPSALQLENAPALRDFVDYMWRFQAEAVWAGRSTQPFVPRLHYWLMLQAVFDWAGNDMAAALHKVSGYDIWKCYNEAPAGFYTQIGGGPDEQLGDLTKPSGGYPTCYWRKDTVTGSEQVADMAPRQLKLYVMSGKTALGQQAEHPCPGCAYPRLTSHIISTETGMSSDILPSYLARRREALGF